MTRVLWAVGWLLIAVVAAVCLLPGRELPQVPLSDKVHHVVAYFGLAAYFTGIVARPRWWRLFLWLLAFGIVIELCQEYMSLGRQGDVRDVAANSVGAMLGIIGGRLGLARWPEIVRWMFAGRQAS